MTHEALQAPRNGVNSTSPSSHLSPPSPTPTADPPIFLLTPPSNWPPRPPLLVIFMLAPTTRSPVVGSEWSGPASLASHPRWRGAGWPARPRGSRSSAIQTRHPPRQQGGSRPSTCADDLPDEAPHHPANHPPHHFRRLRRRVRVNRSLTHSFRSHRSLGFRLPPIRRHPARFPPPGVASQVGQATRHHPDRPPQDRGELTRDRARNRHDHPPAIAPMTSNGSSPRATASGSGASGGS